jgi:hypothetical protein
LALLILMLSPCFLFCLVLFYFSCSSAIIPSLDFLCGSCRYLSMCGSGGQLKEARSPVQTYDCRPLLLGPSCRMPCLAYCIQHTACCPSSSLGGLQLLHLTSRLWVCLRISAGSLLLCPFPPAVGFANLLLLPFTATGTSAHRERKSARAAGYCRLNTSLLLEKRRSIGRVAC